MRLLGVVFLKYGTVSKQYTTERYGDFIMTPTVYRIDGDILVPSTKVNGDSHILIFYYFSH